MPYLQDDTTGRAQRVITPARGALASLSLTMLLASLGTSSVNVALPTLAETFRASFQGVQWVVLAYLVAVTALVVGVGRIGDLLGRRRLLLVGLLCFGLASAACAMAPTLGFLIGARVAQGIGGAVMMALTLALVTEAVPESRTGSAMGLLGTMSAAGTAFGPSVGGVLIDTVSWPAIFWVNVPIGALALGLAWQYLPPDVPHSDDETRGFDVAGASLLTIALAAYALAMTAGEGGLSLSKGALLTATLAGGVAFVMVERRVPIPLVRLAALRDGVLSGGLAMSALVMTVMMATLIVGPFYLSGTLNLEPTWVGLVMSVGPGVVMVTGVPAGRLVDRFGAAHMTTAGLACATLGSALLVVVPTEWGVPGYVGALVTLTAGYGVFHAANNTAVMAGADADRRGVVSGLLNLSRNLGLITGASFMATVFAVTSGAADISDAAPEAVAIGMRATFAVGAALFAIALVIAVKSRPPVPRRESAGKFS